MRRTFSADHFVDVNKMIGYRGIIGNCPEILDSSRQLFEIFDQFASFAPRQFSPPK
jgi:hypothetical protein